LTEKLDDRTIEEFQSLGIGLKTLAALRLDYDFQTISDHPFLLPLKAENRMTTDQARTRNEVEFRSYQKFSIESEIKYDAPAEPNGAPAQPPK
jgi:hypothetical protein